MEMMEPFLLQKSSINSSKTMFSLKHEGLVALVVVVGSALVAGWVGATLVVEEASVAVGCTATVVRAAVVVVVESVVLEAAIVVVVVVVDVTKVVVVVVDDSVG
jgi:hypothetical protein